MKKKMSPHIIAAGAFVVFIVLGLACASAPQQQMSLEERKAIALKPENNKFKIDRSMATKNVPIKEQCFLFCDVGMEVKNKIFMSYKDGIVVLPVDSERIWARYLQNAEMEITFTSQDRSALSVLGGQDNLKAPTLEAGQFYWLFSPTWVVAGYKQVAFLILPLNDEGIEIYTKNIWNKLGTKDKDEWNSYEEYHDFVKQMWEVRKEEARKQF
jgi:hypothetical protein